MVDFECITVERTGPTVRVTMNRPERRNALGLAHLTELSRAFGDAAAGDATGVVLAGNGPVFSAGHDLGEMAGQGEPEIRHLLEVCTGLMTTIHRMPQVVVARVHGLATAAGCQLVAACDLAVAAESAAFAVPGGKGGWFCTTPMVEVGRAVARKRAVELALTGDPVDARTAEAWGLVNRCVPDDELDAAVEDLLARATRGSAASRGVGKPALYRQLGLPLDEAYDLAVAVMAGASQLPDAQEGMRAFVEKRPPIWAHDADGGAGS
jgi:enoyl-CoA hydratase/carnithine racemase